MKLRLKSQIQEVKGVCSFIFEPQQQLQWQPGQYLHYRLQHDNPDNRGVERWFTIASAPSEKFVRLTTRFDGQRISSFKSALLKMRVGDEIEADGPKGQFILQEGAHCHVFIAGGIGVTPFRSMIIELVHARQQKQIDLLYANRDSNLVFGGELKNLRQTYSSLCLKEFVGRKLAQKDFSDYLRDKTAIYYLSGPRPMVESYESLLRSKQVEKTSIMTDYFPGY